VSAEEAELAAKQAEAARKEKLLAAALAKEDAGGHSGWAVRVGP
jgi:hypothetical protein